MTKLAFRSRVTAVVRSMILGGLCGLSGCTSGTSATLDGTEGATEDWAKSENGLATINGLSALNGLTAINGLMTVNGLSALNGLSTIDGVAPGNTAAGSEGLMTTASGRTTLSYLVRCALPTGHSISKQDQDGVWYTFDGELGVGPEWETGACDLDCLQEVSACLMAHVNTSGQHIALMLDGDSPALGWGQDPSYPFQEGSFFGNLFTSPPEAYYCEGRDFKRGVVHGRIGADQNNAPYVDPGGTDSPCSQLCMPADSPHQDDGFKACYGYYHVVTVWRDFDPNTPYVIGNDVTNTVIDARGFTAFDGANVVAWEQNGATSQQWFIKRSSPGLYTVVNVLSGKCLEINTRSTPTMTGVDQSTCNGRANQLWRFLPKGEGFFEVRPQLATNATVAMCLDVARTSSVNGANIELTDCGKDGQAWMVSLATP